MSRTRIAALSIVGAVGLCLIVLSLLTLTHRAAAIFLFGLVLLFVAIFGCGRPVAGNPDGKGDQR